MNRTRSYKFTTESTNTKNYLPGMKNAVTKMKNPGGNQ